MAKADAAATKGRASAPAPPAVCPTAMRSQPLGQDRTGALFWRLQCAAAFAGTLHLSELLILVLLHPCFHVLLNMLPTVLIHLCTTH